MYHNNAHSEGLNCMYQMMH